MKLSNHLKLLCLSVVVLFSSMSTQAEVIRVGDVLEISLRGVPAAEQAKVYSKLEVRSSGTIRIPMVNEDVKAVGRNAAAVERNIEAMFKNAEIYQAPTISIQVHRKKDEIEVIQSVVVVSGQVRRPGRVQFRQGMILAEAIEQAGGRGTFASKYFYLTRKNPKSGKLLRHKYNYNNTEVHTLKIFPNDLITIPIRGAIIDKG